MIRPSRNCLSLLIALLVQHRAAPGRLGLLTVRAPSKLSKAKAAVGAEGVDAAAGSALLGSIAAVGDSR